MSMNQQLSGKMKKMTHIYRWVIVLAAVLCMAAVFMVIGITMKTTGRDMIAKGDVPGIFDSRIGGVYGQLEIRAMTDEFAADFKDTKHFYIALDSNMKTCIVHMHGEVTDELLRLQNYFYGLDDSGIPPSVTVTGISAWLEKDIRDYAAKSFNEMVEEEVITSDNFTSYFGEYYLDTTKRPVSPLEKQAAVPFAASFLSVMAAVGIVISNIGKTKAGRRTLAAWPAEMLSAIDRQLSNPDTVAFEKERLYLTDDYIVTNANGFEILPYSALQRVYDTTAGNGRRRIAVETKDHRNYVLAAVSVRGDVKKAHFARMFNRVKKQIEEKKEELAATLYGPGTDAAEMEYVLEGMPRGFDYAGTGTVAPIPEIVTVPSSNLLPGLIGALMGSLAGAVLWILIGQIGFIAGIAGYAILILSVKGYEKLGGSIDKKGAVCCLIVSAFMVFGANVLGYAVSLIRAYFVFDASFETVIFVLTHFIPLMEEYEMWGSFVLDIVVGFLLSLWSSYRTIGTILNLRQDFSAYGKNHN